jgi:nitroreductase
MEQYPMEFKEIVLKRRMVRNFADRLREPAILDRILELTRHAPSAGFTQGQSFLLVTDPETKKAIAMTCEENGPRPTGSWTLAAPS